MSALVKLVKEIYVSYDIDQQIFQEKLVTCRHEFAPCRVERKTLRSEICRCTLRFEREVESTIVATWPRVGSVQEASSIT